MDDEPAARAYPHAPPMGAGNPEPVVLHAPPTLWVAYRTRRTDAGDLFAVVRFGGVEEHRVGPPGADRLEEHPLHGRGLEPDAFHEVVERLADAYASRRWVVTFRQETLEVRATSVEVAARGVEAASGWEALRAVVPAAS